MRHIDADALIEALQTDYDREGAKADEMALNGLADISVKYSHGQFCFLNAIDRVKGTPTADVVPKSEVERLEQILNSYALQYGTVKDQQAVIDKAKAAVASEIITEAEEFLNFLEWRSYWDSYKVGSKFAELKKKYTEGSEK